MKSAIAIHALVALCACALWLPASSQADSPSTTMIQHKLMQPPLKVGVSFSIPPWVIRDGDRGIELDLLNEAFALQGYQVEPVYMAFARVYNSFDDGKLDGVVNVKPGSTQGGFISDTVVSFQNYAVSLKSKNFPEQINPDFLVDKTVIGFQKASRLLGEGFHAMSMRNPKYSEVAKQHVQVNLLFVREVDFIVMDKSIFGYYWRKAINGNTRHGDTYRKAVTFHPMFPKSDYSYMFKEQHVRDAFNAGLAQLRMSGRYDEILNEYDDLTDLYSELKLAQPATLMEQITE